MDLSSPTSTTNSPLTPVFGDNVQDLLGTGALNVNPSAIITVNSIADTVDDPSSGVITLRDAINQANADNGQDLIVFDRSVFSNAQTITLSGTELDITHNLDIIAPRDPLTGGDLVTVSGNNASRVFEIETGATVTVSGLIVADGNVAGANSGGGIKNSGTLTLDNSTISGNSCTKDNVQFVSGYGGGIFNTGTMNVRNSTISGNSISGDYGGGIYNGGTMNVRNSTISGNSVSDSNLLFIPAGTKIENGGGGIYNSGTMTVSTSTISGNSVSGQSIYGGGIFNRGKLTLAFSTFTLNQAKNGGGVYNSPGYTNLVLGGTIPPGSTNVRNTIIASNLNSDGGVNPDVFGTFISNGYNLIGDGTRSTGFGVTGDIVGTSDNPIDPLLAPLAFNGGSTQTVALQTGSPAIGAGDPTVLDTDPTTDQRGFPRRAVDGTTDIGAFEFSS